MIINIYPISNVCTLSINRNFFILVSQKYCFWNNVRKHSSGSGGKETSLNVFKILGGDGCRYDNECSNTFNGSPVCGEKYFNLDGRSGSWTFKPLLKVPLAGDDDYEIYDNEWGHGLGLGYEFETARFLFSVNTSAWVYQQNEPFESHSSLDLGYNFLAWDTNGTLMWETDFHYENDGSETLSAGPALYWNLNDTAHLRFEWKHDFYDRQGVLDHGNGSTFKFGIGFVF